MSLYIKEYVININYICSIIWYYKSNNIMLVIIILYILLLQLIKYFIFNDKHLKFILLY